MLVSLLCLSVFVPVSQVCLSVAVVCVLWICLRVSIILMRECLFLPAVVSGLA